MSPWSLPSLLGSTAASGGARVVGAPPVPAQGEAAFNESFRHSLYRVETEAPRGDVASPWLLSLRRGSGCPAPLPCPSLGPGLPRPTPGIQGEGLSLTASGPRPVASQGPDPGRGGGGGPGPAWGLPPPWPADVAGHPRPATSPLPPGRQEAARSCSLFCEFLEGCCCRKHLDVVQGT